MAGVEKFICSDTRDALHIKMDRQLQVDLETLHAVVPGLERLEAEWNDAKLSVAAKTRGYCPS